MNINDIPSGKPQIGGQSLTELEPKKTPSKPVKDHTSPYQDTVELTEKSNILNQLHTHASEQPYPVDEGKIAQMQKLIDSGAYQVNPKAIAENIFHQELELMGLFTTAETPETLEESS